MRWLRVAVLAMLMLSHHDCNKLLSESHTLRTLSDAMSIAPRDIALSTAVKKALLINTKAVENSACMRKEP
jgi:hypothetical protein